MKKWLNKYNTPKAQKGLSLSKRLEKLKRDEREDVVQESTKTDSRKAPTKQEIEEYKKYMEPIIAYDRYTTDGEIRPAEEQSTFNRLKAIALNPTTALSYAVQNKPLPYNFERGERNATDYAIDVINPVQYVQDAYNVGEGTVKGNLGQVGEGLLGVVPLALESKNIYKGLKKVGKKNIDFKSEIDWGKWNKEIPENKALMKEYNTIEQQSKADGTWMKNPDGSKFKGTPEQFVQQNSENFKKAFPKGSNISYRGDLSNLSEIKSQQELGKEALKRKYNLTDEDTDALEKLWERSKDKLNSGKYTTNDYDAALKYAKGDKNKVLSLYTDIRNPKFTETGESFRVLEKDRQKLLSEGYDALITKPSSFYPEGENVLLRNNQIKSAIGNNGMFDMTNPNIYNGFDFNFITKPLTPLTKNELTPGTHLYRKIGDKKGLQDLINKGGAQAPSAMKMNSGQMLDAPFFGIGKKPNENYRGLFAVETAKPSMSKYKWSNKVGGTSNYGVAPIDSQTGKVMNNVPLEDLEVYRKKWFSNNYKKLDKNNLEKGMEGADTQKAVETMWKWGIRGALVDQLFNDGEYTGGKWLDKFQNGGTITDQDSVNINSQEPTSSEKPVLSREDFLKQWNLNYANKEYKKGYLQGVTPYYKDEYISTEEGNMNCINGVCQITEALTDKDFTGGRGTEGSFIGNQYFNSRRNDENYYNVQLNADNRYLEPGDIIQASRFKHKAFRVDNKNFENNPSDKYTLVPQHAYAVGKVNKDENGKPVSYELIHNAGGKYIIDNKVLTQEQLQKHMSEGFWTDSSHHYDGYLINRYDPSYIQEKNQKLENQNKVKNVYAKDYDNAVNTVVPKDIEGVKSLYPELGEVVEHINNNYSELGKKSGLPKELFNKFLNYQIGIAGQESRFGDDKGLNMDISSENLLKIGRKIKKNISGRDPDGWKKILYENNVEGVVDKFDSFLKFKESLSKENEQVNPFESKIARESLANLTKNKSLGMYQIKEVSKTGKDWGITRDQIKKSVPKQFEASLALMIDNYNYLKEQYPNKSEDELAYLAALSHNAPGKARTPIYANYFGSKRNIDYVNKALLYSDAILNTKDLRAVLDNKITFHSDKKKLDTIINNHKAKKSIQNKIKSIKDNTVFPDSTIKKDIINTKLPKIITPISNKIKISEKEAKKLYEEILKEQKQFKSGGIIEDNRGQWAHPGEVTRINNNRITMKNVPYPVLGISDTGDTQLMQPEQEYKFKGNNVTEYPINWLNKYK